MEVVADAMGGDETTQGGYGERGGKEVKDILREYQCLSSKQRKKLNKHDKKEGPDG